METRSHIVLVSTVVALVFAALVAFVMWITPRDANKGRQYDIVFDQSVSGLIEGSAVTFAGIPVGRVQSVALEPGKPDLVRVRIAIIKDDLPILQGTSATLKGDLAFGSATINLEAADRQGGPIPLNPDGIGVIPAESAGLTELAGDPGPLLDRLSRGTDMLLELTSPAGQREIAQKLDASASATAALARESGAIDGRIAQTRASIRLTASSASDFGRLADARARQLETRGSSSMRELRASSAAARESIRSFDARLVSARGQAADLSQSAAALGTKTRAVRTQVRKVGSTLKDVEAGGAGAALSEPTLPDYRPAN